MIPKVSAQTVTPVEDRMLRDSIDENRKRNRDQAARLEVIKSLTEDTKQEVEATLQLQQNYRTFLKQTGSTAFLEVMNSDISEKGATQAGDASEALGDYSFAASLNDAYQQATDPMDNSQSLYEQLVPYDETLMFTDFAAWREDQQSRQLNLQALEEMSHRRKLTLAKAYQQMAKQKIVQADELRGLLTSHKEFSMTEAERVETLSRMQHYLLRSQQLKTKADELIRKAGQPSFLKAGAVSRFRQQQERKALSTVPLFQD